MTHEEVLDEVNVIYERISNNENDLFSDGKYTEALEILIDYYEVGFIEELEKIKAKIESEYWDEFDGNTVIADNQIERIFSKYIAELKGKQE